MVEFEESGEFVPIKSVPEAIRRLESIYAYMEDDPALAELAMLVGYVVTQLESTRELAAAVAAEQDQLRREDAAAADAGDDQAPLSLPLSCLAAHPLWKQ